MGLPREATSERNTVPQDIAGYVRLGIRVIREACKDAMFARGYRRRKAARWIAGYESDEELSLGWYLDHLGGCDVCLPPRYLFRELAEDSNAGVIWRRDEKGIVTRIEPEKGSTKELEDPDPPT